MMNWAKGLLCEIVLQSKGTPRKEGGGRGVVSSCWSVKVCGEMLLKGYK